MIVLSLWSAFASAQEDARKIRLDSRRPIRIDYLAPSWNRSPDTQESSAIIIRDSLTGRVVKVEVMESGPNTAYFVGVYQIAFTTGDKIEITPEIYVAPLSLIKSDQALNNINGLIREGTLLRKPYFLRTEKGIQTISVFDSRAQAVEAYQSFLKTGMGRPLIDPAVFDAQRLAQKTRDELARAAEAARAEENRKSLEAEEKKRQEERIRQQAALNAAEKARRRQQAQALAEEGMRLYQKEDYAAAEEKFNKSTELDPENDSYNFPYGVTLYRNEKYNAAIVRLRLAQGEKVNINERDYFIALSHMRLKEYDQASNLFSELRKREDKVLSPSAAFFSGVIDFQQENYDSAKINFEYVLDNSVDAAMDQQAESYIEQIANIKQFEEMRKKKFILSANLGLMYDSNILSVSAANAPTDLAGLRWSYSGSLEYRPVFSEKNEFSAILTLADMYSMDSAFKAKTEFQNTDPLVLNLSLPYKRKGIYFGKPAQLGLTPAYETIQMNADGEGPRENIVNSTVLKGDATLVMTEDHYANYALELRSDNSMIEDAGDDDVSASKITLSTSQTVFQDKRKTTAIIGEGALSLNTALGDNQSYNRLDLAGSYLMPAFGESNFITRLGLGYATYPKHLVGRTDTNYNLSLVLMKQVSESFGATLTGSYTKNNSTLETSVYDKYMIMTGMNWRVSF